MNELIPVHDRDRPLVAELDTEMVDWYVSNMPPNTIRVYKKAVDKIDTWLAGLPSTMPRSLGLSNSRKLSEIIPLNRIKQGISLESTDKKNLISVNDVKAPKQAAFQNVSKEEGNYASWWIRGSGSRANW